VPATGVDAPALPKPDLAPATDAVEMPRYQIGEGVRRSVATRELRREEIAAHLYGSEDVFDVRLDQLYVDPVEKGIIPFNQRYIDVSLGVLKNETPPITVSPVSLEYSALLMPLSKVQLTRSRGNF
jgi:hypothetical protein